MTRENKLALVVGFGLILFVGILISDHFSTVRSQRAANLAGRESAVDPLASRAPDAGLIDLNPTVLQPPPIAANTSALGNVSPNTGQLNADQHTNTEVALNPESTNASSTDARLTALPEKTPEGFVPIGLQENPIPVIVRHHEIRAGDSLYAICKQYYGDTTLLSAFAKFNSIDDPGNLKVGAKLLIPPAEAIGGKPAIAANPKVEPNASAPVDPNVHVKVEQSTTIKLPVKGLKSPSPPRVTYVVKPGDSLRTIALRVYGSKENWKKLRDLNRDVIDDPDDLKVGTLLKL